MAHRRYLKRRKEELTKGQAKTSQQEVVPKEWKLEPEHEFRFEVDFGTTVNLKLISGTAEIFGTEIGIGHVFMEI
ncbi:Clp1-domain-containing protein [Rhizophagus clarus]|uniref:Clp1-domain-containing protein n=1 Tax=Rhizophagus clarus TaxID=94130 RepID=A0A8H3LTC3_9GLOM|nr:Clp1-domain-containing protein [Rhizophagus clarus]